MPGVHYRAVLDASDVLTKLSLIESRFVALGSRAAVQLRVDGSAALKTISDLEARIRRLGTGTATPRITLSMGARQASVDPAITQLAQLERQTRQLTAAMGMNLGMSQRLGGIFAFIPGPIGLYASAASTLTSSLTGLNAAQRMNTLGAFALVGGLAAIGAATAGLAAHGIKQLKEFQQAFNIMTLQGPEVAARLDAQVRALQERGGRPAQQFNRSELGIAAAELTKQGLDEATAFQVVAQSLKLAGAEGENLNEVSTLLLANLRQFGKDGKDAGNSAEEFTDKITRASTAAATSAVNMQRALSVVGPFADKAGFTLNETLGFLTALDNAGMKADTIGANSFRAVLMALGSPSGPAREQVEKLGVSFEDLNGKARPVRDILFDLLKVADQSGETYDAATKAALTHADTVEAAATIFRSRGVVGFLNMAGSAQKWIDTVENAKITSTEYADAMTNGPGKAQERLRKSLDDLSLSFAQTFGPKLSQGLDNVTQLFRDIDGMAQHPETLKAYFDVVVTGLGAVTTALILNSEAAKGLLAVNSWSGFITLLQGTVAGGLFQKAAAGLRALALATALNTAAAGGGFIAGVRGLLTALGTIVVGTGAALASVALLAGGVAVYGKKIAADTNAIYDEIEKNQNESFNRMMVRVNELRKQGPLGQLKAKQLLTINLRYNYENSPEQNAKLDAQLLKLKQQVQAETEHQATLAATKKVKVADATATAEQTAAYDALKNKLSELRGQFAESKTTSFQKSLRDARKSLEDFGKAVDDQLAKGELTPVQASALRKEAKAEQPKLVQSLTQRQLNEDAKTLEGHQREIEQARLNLIRDGRVKREAEYDLEIKGLHEKYGPQIKEALQNAQTKGLSPEQKRGFQETAGRLQQQENEAVKAARGKLNQDLAQIDEDRAKKVRDGHTAGLTQLATEMDGRTKLLEQEYQRQQQLTEGNVAARLQMERRLAPALEAQQVAARNARLTGEREALENEYADALKAAAEMGGQRSALEAQARQAYLSKSRALEQAYQNDIQGYHLDTLSAIQAAGAAVTKEQLDLDLRSAKEWTGAQLAAYATVLRAKQAAALAGGDADKAKVFGDALERISEIKTDNLRDFRGALGESADKAGELRTQLREIAQTPLEAARKSAASPFDGVLKGAEKQLADLRKAYGKVAAPTGDQTAEFRRREQQLTGIMTTATAQRAQAQAGAEAKYWRDREDKAEATHLKLSKRELDLGRLTMDGYAEVLAADRAYWQARLAHAVKGSEDEQNAQDKLRENEDERTRLQGERRAYAKDSAAFSREQLQTALELATNEKDRSSALERLNAADQRRLGDLDREIASLTQQGGHEKEVLALKRERAGVQKELVTRQREELDHARALTDSVLARVDAENKLAQRRARTDAEVLAAQLGGLANLQNQLGALDTNIGNARSDEERNRLLAERSNLLGQIEDQELAVAQLPLDIERQKAEVLKSQVQLRLQQLGLQDDEVATAQAAVAEAESTLTIARHQLDLMRQKGTPEQQRAAETAYNQAQVGLLTAQNALQDAPIKAQERRLGLYRQLVQAQLTLNGLQDDEVASAGLALDVAQQDLLLAQEKVVAAKTTAEREAAAAGLRVAQAAVRTAQQGVDEAPLKARERLLGLYRDQQAAQLVLNHLQDDEVASASSALDVAQRELNLAQDRYDQALKSGTLVQQQAAQAALDKAQAGVVTAQQGVDEAPLRARERLLGLYRDQQAAQLVLNRMQDDEVASASSALDVAQQELGIAQDRYDLAMKSGTLAQQQAAQAALDKARAGVTTAQQQVDEAPVRAEERRLALTRQAAQARLMLAGLDDNEVASARAALDAAEGQLALAQHRVDVAGTAVEREKAAADLVTAQADAEKARSGLRQAGVAQLERQLGVVRQLAQAQLILRGLNDDELAQARQAVSFAEQDLALAQQRLAVARTPVEREKAGADVAGAEAALLQAQQQQRLAPIAQQERLLGLFRQQADERRVVAGLDEDAVATGQQALLIAQEETRLAQARVDAGGTQVQVEQAQGELAAKRTAELQAQRSLIRAQLADLDASRDRVRSQVQGQAELSGLTRDSVAAKALELEFTRLDRQETERRLAQARELMLTDTEVADLQVKRTQQLAQEVKARQEVNKAALEQQRLQLDLAEATARSQLARSRFFDDSVAQSRIGLAVTREHLRLLDEQLAQTDELGLSTAEQLSLQKERQGLLAQEADGVRQLAQAERDRLVFVRSLRDALDGLREIARDQSENTAILRASDVAALSLNRLKEAQADAAGFLGQRGDLLAYHEAAQGKERVEALTSAISDYRSKLAAVADAQEQRITSMEGMIDAVRRLNDLSNSPGASAFTAEVVERQRQQALAETSRVLNDQRATYGQIASAVGRLAQAEGDRIAVQQKQLAGLADRVKGSDRGAITELRQQLSDLGLSWQEVNTTIGKVQKEGSSALGSVTARLSQEAEARLDELRGRALDALNDIGQLRAEAFKNRLESAKAFEEYARLSSAVKLADAGFSELEANQIATLNRQEALKNLIAQTSALDPSFISRKVAREAVEAENRALIEQVRLRRGLKDDRAVTRADLEQQRAISAQWVQQSALQRSAAEAALVPYSQRVELSKQTAEALKDEEAQLARMVAEREGGDFTKVSRAKIEQQRRLLEQEIIAQERTRRILGENDKQDYDPNSPEVKAAIALDLAIEDARYGSKRMARALNFEKEKARQVAEIYAAAIAAAIQKALESTRVGGAARDLGETAGAALQQEMASVVRPGARSAVTPLGSAERTRALAAALRVTVEVPRSPAMAAASQVNNNQKTVTIFHNYGGITLPMHTVEKVDPAKIAPEILHQLQLQNDLMGARGCD